MCGVMPQSLLGSGHSQWSSAAAATRRLGSGWTSCRARSRRHRSNRGRRVRLAAGASAGSADRALGGWRGTRPPIGSHSRRVEAVEIRPRHENAPSAAARRTRARGHLARERRVGREARDGRSGLADAFPVILHRRLPSQLPCVRLRSTSDGPLPSSVGQCKPKITVPSGVRVSVPTTSFAVG
jgi:hypothetical protein